jgi:hypothetical protein
MLGLARPRDLAAHESLLPMSPFRQFLAENKIWWILPIVIVLLVVGFVLATSGDSGDSSPFVYDVF